MTNQNQKRNEKNLTQERGTLRQKLCIDRGRGPWGAKENKADQGGGGFNEFLGRNMRWSGEKRVVQTSPTRYLGRGTWNHGGTGGRGTK